MFEAFVGTARRSTVQQLLRQRLADDSAGVKYVERRWTWRERRSVKRALIAEGATARDGQLWVRGPRGTAYSVQRLVV